VSDEPVGPDLSLLSPLQEEYAGRGRDALLPMLFDCQSLYGWLPRQVQHAVSETLRVPLADIHGVIEFYTMLYNRPTARKVVRVCDDLACSLAGAEAIIETVGQQLGLAPGETSPSHSVTFELAPCLGMCDQAPCALVDERPGGQLLPEGIADFLEGQLPVPAAIASGEMLMAASNVGKEDAASLEQYLANDGYKALKTAMAMGPEEYIEFVEGCGILGRGGAMFPLGRKWRFTRAAKGEVKFVVVNGDESEPGTFKDRCFMEEDPHAVVEGATLAAYAVGAQKGWIGLIT
jgi:NADH-quinone oxidoreductase subunit F